MSEPRARSSLVTVQRWALTGIFVILGVAAGVQRIEQLQSLCEAGDTAAVMSVVRELAPEYVPSEHALTLATRGRKANVASLPQSSTHAQIAKAKAAGA